MPKGAPAKRVAAPAKQAGPRREATKWLYSTATDGLRVQTAGKTPKQAAEIRKRWLRSTNEGVMYKAALHRGKLAKHAALREFGLATAKTISVLKKPSKKGAATAAAPAAPRKQKIKIGKRTAAPIPVQPIGWATEF